MMMMMMILKAFGVFSYIRERLFFRASDEISSEKSLEKSVFFCFRLSRKLFCPSFRRSSHKTAENFLKRRKVIDLFIRAYPALLPRAVILQTHRRTIKSSFSFFAV